MAILLGIILFVSMAMFVAGESVRSLILSSKLNQVECKGFYKYDIERQIVIQDEVRRILETYVRNSNLDIIIGERNVDMIIAKTKDNIHAANSLVGIVSEKEGWDVNYRVLTEMTKSIEKDENFSRKTRRNY